MDGSRPVRKPPAAWPRRLLAALALAGMPWAHAASVAVESVEAELRAIEEQRREAIRAKDFEMLARIYATDFVGVTSNGQIVNRDQLFRIFATADASLTFAVDEVRVVLREDVSVFVGRLTARTPRGAIAFTSRFSHTFVRRDGRWVCVSGHATPIARP